MAGNPLNLLSVVVPARDEEESLPPTIAGLTAHLEREGVPHEIVVVDDGSRDRSAALLRAQFEKRPEATRVVRM